MNYIVTALKPEAQAFVDKYKLKKNKLADFTVYQNEQLVLIVSSLGIENATLATQALLNTFNITDYDIFLNIGICGANRNHNIGNLLEISFIDYAGKIFKLNDKDGYTISCIDKEAYEATCEIVDMESYGFYRAFLHTTDNARMFKVVSDHFEPHKVTKEKTKSLIFNAIEEILEKVRR